MIKQIVKKLIALIIIVMVLSHCSPSLKDISPDRDDGVSDGGISTAGLTINMAGDKNGLYAIGLNSGVWKTETDGKGSFNKWRQLSKSPRYAHCIAVDPQDHSHIVVGERKGDAIADNNCGLWESFNGGNTFQRKNFLLKSPCSYNIVNAVAITNKSTILSSTPNGICRKEKNESSFFFPADVANKSFTAVATFKDWIVARTKNEIFISIDDGKNWKNYPIQLTFASQNFTLDYEGDRAGNYSVSIIQLPQSNNVFVYVPATRATNDPNNGSCLIFNNQTHAWDYQIIMERGLGIALGGRIFVKSFFSENANLQNTIAGNTNLVYCAGQNIFSAASISADGKATWINIANADIQFEPMPQDFHADIWDFLIDPSGSYTWVSCDGGVYYHPLDANQTTITLNNTQKYLNLNSGLHTQHIHESFVAGFQGKLPGQEHYGYGSQDNGGWGSVSIDGITNWKQIAWGDENIIEGDQGNPELVVVATNLQTAVLAGLQSTGNPPPVGAKLGPTTISYVNSRSFQFIQTLITENPHPLLDAVMLTDLPLKYVKDPEQYKIDHKLTNVDLGSQSGPVIIRNQQFAANPDINLSAGSGWNIEFNDLPQNPQAFWVSGGHLDPTYFLICNQSNNTVLFRRKKSESSWTQINMPEGIQIIPYTTGQVQHGPVFVNPYNQSEIYISCKDGIYHSVPAARRVLLFEKDIQLTNLVSGDGKYPIDRTFTGGNGLNVAWSNQSSGNAMYPVSWVSFNRFNPKQAVASSPFTGVFFKDGNKKWRDLSDVLPKPFTPVSSVNINNQGIYVTTEGRGMFLIQNY